MDTLAGPGVCVGVGGGVAYVVVGDGEGTSDGAGVVCSVGAGVDAVAAVSREKGNKCVGWNIGQLFNLVGMFGENIWVDAGCRPGSRHATARSATQWPCPRRVHRH